MSIIVYVSKGLYVSATELFQPRAVRTINRVRRDVCVKIEELKAAQHKTVHAESKIKPSIIQYASIDDDSELKKRKAQERFHDWLRSPANTIRNG